jgi:hypothetical protein
MCIKHKCCGVITISPFDPLPEGKEKRREESSPVRTAQTFKNLIANWEGLEASANAMFRQNANSV